ncbi:MAG: RES family NAD+ phosphorylase [Gordonia sp. (in: high G+C Gram-positive bacteria)]|uniref:RES family NAD+ phosphorylase n=1 Tax=Gordonia sp. (in: high G+C Gram-positive bacteria) TaxID=84139 RepID=UPI0039E4323F
MSEHLAGPDPSRFPPLNDEYVREIDVDVPLGRIYFADGEYPATWNGFRYFGPTTSRFDHQEPPAALDPVRGVLYLAPSMNDARGDRMSSVETALLECFRDRGIVDVSTDRPYFALFTPVRRLRLLDLSDSEWVTVAGANAAITSGPREAARQWARAVYDRYDDVDGVFYATSNRPLSRSIALWERGADAFPTRPTLNMPLDHMGLRAAVESFAARVGLGLLW